MPRHAVCYVASYLTSLYDGSVRGSALAEKRWIILASDGRHVTVGRHTDPEEDEIISAESGLRAQGLSGWLAVTDGGYYGRGKVSILMVRPLASPPDDAWEAAVASFIARRNQTNQPRGQRLTVVVPGFRG